MPVCQTDNLQMSAPGLWAHRPYDCHAAAVSRDAWELRDGSWLFNAFRVQGPPASRGDTRTHCSCIMYVSTCTFNQGHIHTDTPMNYFYTIRLLSVCLHQGRLRRFPSWARKTQHEHKHPFIHRVHMFLNVTYLGTTEDISSLFFFCVVI